MAISETPHVILAELPGEVRTAFLATLKDVGVETVDLVSKGEDLVRQLASGTPDLLVVNYRFSNGEGEKIVRDLRMDRLGEFANPFMPVVMTSWDNDDGPVRAALSTGADDLLIFPIPMGTLRKRVEVLAHKRKPFIVTSDYIGPERRKDPNRTSEIPYFEPPNTLGQKLRGDPIDRAETRQAIDRLRREVSAEKMRRDAFQVAFLARLLAEDHENGASYPELESRLHRIAAVADQILLRATPEQADSLASMIETMTETIAVCDEDSDEDTLNRMIHLLEPVAQGITLTIRDDETADGLSSEVQKTVATFRTRSRERASHARRSD
ncbi:MAG: response regulator [Alphaproteobacteria bacterium]|nr:response regulator [Alphaproteobacteria bacterium]